MKTLREYINLMDDKNLNEDWRKKAGPLGAAIGGTLGAVAGGIPGAFSGAVGGAAFGYGIQKDRTRITNTDFYQKNLKSAVAFISDRIYDALPVNKYDRKTLVPTNTLNYYIKELFEDYFIKAYGNDTAYNLMTAKVLDSGKIEGVHTYTLVSALKTDVENEVKKLLNLMLQVPNTPR